MRGFSLALEKIILFLGEEKKEEMPQSWLATQDLSKLDPTKLSPLTEEVCSFFFSAWNPSKKFEGSIVCI